ncbi:MAG: hypothetical protein FJ211_02930 [Ignavibacteria bacterium]|nr:hypothetical protein [Ignavibacteria bacterium]
MGYDQGNVPVKYNVTRLYSNRCARAGILLGALFFFRTVAICGNDEPANRCGFTERADRNRIQRGKSIEILGSRPPLPLHTESSDGKFRVHYAVVGPDAVDTIDRDANGSPDYVDECLRALQRSWKLEIDTLGYAPPPGDDTTGGSRAIDVYLHDLGREGYYGITNLDRLLALTPSERYTTWVEIDNNFSPTDSTWSGKQSYSTFGVDALRVTCAHELHHVIQNGSYGYNGQQRMFYELSSTWMEMRAYPEVRDWAVWTSFLLTRPELWPFSKSNALNGYCWGWFGNVLTAGQVDIMKSTWDHVGKGREPFTALNAACTSASTTFKDVFCGALSSLYQTGARGSGNPYLPSAELLPEIKFFADISAESISESLTGTMRPFEVVAVRSAIPSLTGQPISVGQVLSWTSGPAILNRPDSTISFGVTLTPTPLPNDELVNGSTWAIRYEPNDALCRFYLGTQLLFTEAPYPQPYRSTEHEFLYVPVPNSTAGDNVQIQVCNTLLQPLTHGTEKDAYTAQVNIYHNRLVAQFPFDSSTLIPGIYLVVVTRENSQPIIYKLAIER